MDSQLQSAADLLRSSEHIVVFSGAGMSAESGIPTFRDDEGFWKRFPVDDFATWRGIMRAALRQPRLLAQFVHEVMHPIADAAPNPGHTAIERLEHFTRVTVVTQNIDGLHQAAGNTTTHEIHGSLFEVVDRKRRFEKLLSRPQLQRISHGVERSTRSWLPLPRLLWSLRSWLGIGWRGIHIPNLVLFGDSLAEPAWSMALEAARNCDCMLQVGCSGVVLPAAMLPHEAKANGAVTIAIDPMPTAADLWLEGGAADVLPRLIDKMRLA